MKKITFLLALSLALGTFLSAADVSIGGYFETHGKIMTKSGDNVVETEEDTRIMHGSNEFGINININGDGFGGSVHMGAWSAEGMGISTKEHGITSGHIWAEMFPGFKVTAGLGLDGLVSYTPGAAVMYLGDAFGDDLGGSDAFGIGLGKYDYQAANGGYTGGGINGLVAEYNMGALTAALVIKNDATDAKAPWTDGYFATYETLEEAMKNMFNVNVKYSLDTATIFGGFSQKTVTADGVDESQPAIWFAVSTNLMEGLLLDVKYEGIFASDSNDSPMYISTNIGYNFGAINIKTTEEIGITDGEMAWAVAGNITPTLPVAVGLDINAGVKQAAGDDADLLYKFGATLSKGYGNVSASLGVDYELLSENESLITLDAKMSMWF